MLDVKNIQKSINKKTIINKISFSLNTNEIIALVGPNGAGKTTLLNLISNLISTDEGTILFNGQKITNDSFKYISFMQDSSILYNDLTGYQHFKFIAKAHNKDQQIIEDTIKKLKMSDYINRKIKKYSLGMKQHVILGMSLISQPKVLMLDEPLNGLDPDSSLQLRDILLDLKKEGTAILFSSHILSEVDKIADKIIFIKGGEIISRIDNTIQDDRETYSIEIDNIKKAINVIEEYKFKIDKVFENKITIKINTYHFNDLMNILLKENLQILSIEKLKYKLTEDYYYELMGENHE